ncbi:cytochrome P450 CYP82D47 [Pyrus x bretschneideri]|uniref:cytochrome P450 CYP82D47 n=1 Tax=Pyrus x bretschneideri TaxID=225117 RepID=UPI00202F28BE|nr:cytochrome P450 CYP82D47 [Pyrus x bretschneideri]
MEFPIPYPVSFLIILLTSLLLITVRRFRAAAAANAKGPKPPTAAGGWPLTGHLHLFRAPQLPPHITLGALAEKYGPIFTVNIGSRTALVVSSSEVAKECYTTNDWAISSRAQTIGAEILSYNNAMPGFSPYGDYWREMRKIIVQEVLSNRRLELLKHVRESEIELAAKELYKVWTKRKDHSKDNGYSGQLLVELKQWLSDLSLNVMFRMVAGKRYFNLTNIGNLSDEKGERRCYKALRNLFRYMGMFVLGDAFPWLRFLDFGGHEKAMKKNAKELDDMAMDWLEEHKQNRTQDDRDHQDFMDVMLSVLDGQGVLQQAPFDVDTIMRATVVNLIAGGSDTTSLLMGFTVSFLLTNPQALKKVRKELDEHVGKGRLVNDSDINNLVYLQATMKEVLRLTSTFPGFREFTDDCTVGGYYVPKGTWLLVNLWKIHTDPRVWADPTMFKPERFLTSHKDVDVKGQHFELMPVGSGRRVCPGVNFGQQLSLLTLASFLHAFEISAPANATFDTSETFGVSNVKSTLLEVFIKPRLPPNLYT